MNKNNNCGTEKGSTEKIVIFKRPSSTVVQLHTHECIELVCIFTGKGILTINGETAEASRGDLLFYNIGELHCLNTKSEISAINIQIHPGVLDETLATSLNAVDILTLSLFRDFCGIIDDFRPIVTFRGKELMELESVIQNMLLEYNEKRIGYRSVLFGYLNVLFAKLFRKLHSMIKMNIREELSPIAENVLNYIETNLDKKITLNELARMSFCNLSYFSSVFKECFGLSPLQYINSKKIEKATELLKNSRTSIEQVIMSLGYSDKKHFYNLFKQATGLTPGNYRKNFKTLRNE